MITIISLLTNKLLISTLIAILAAQIIKTVFYINKEKKFSLKMLLAGTGGMPSTHTAAVTSLTTTIYLLEGISNLFIVSFIFSLIIIRDAAGVRYAVGEHARIINDLETKVWKKNKSGIIHLAESIGHTPKQVVMGIILGLAVAIITVLL